MDEGPSGASGIAAIIGEAVDRYTPLLWLVVTLSCIGVIVAMLAPAIEAVVWATLIGVIVVLPSAWILDQLKQKAWRELRVAAVGIAALAALGTTALCAMTLLARLL